MFLNKEQLEFEFQLWENRIVKNCEKCNGVGAILNNDDGEYKTYINCECKKNSWLNANLVDWGIPRKYLSNEWTWDNFEHVSFIEKSKNYADNFVENYMNCKGLFFYGAQGRGKSTMESMIAKTVAKLTNPDTNKYFKPAFAIYEDIVQLSHQSRVNFDALQKLKNLCYKPDLLIIDNIGSETGFNSETKHTTKLLDLILRKRDNMGYPTILSSNFTPDEISKFYSDTVRDFIENNCELIAVTGDNFRKKNENIYDFIDCFDQ